MSWIKCLAIYLSKILIGLQLIWCRNQPTSKVLVKLNDTATIHLLKPGILK